MRVNFLYGLLISGLILTSCTESGSGNKTTSSTDTSSSSGGDSGGSDNSNTFVIPTATSGNSDSGQVTSGCISGDGTGSDGVFALVADGSGGNRISGDGMTANGSGYTISGGHIWSLSKDSDISDKEILGAMDQGASVEILVQPQTNPGGENIGNNTYCNTGANYTRLTMTVLLGKYKNGIFYPSDEHTYSTVNVNDCSPSTSFSIPSYNLGPNEYPDVVVKSVKSDGDCISYGAGCDDPDPLVAKTACWRTRVYVKMPYATGW